MTPPTRSPGRDRPLRWRFHLQLVALLPLALGLSWAAGRAPEWSERIYSQGVYPVIAGFLARTFGWLPFAAVEVLILLLMAIVMVRILRGLRAWRKGRRTLANLAAQALIQLLSGAALAVFLFTALWGLNYRRSPLGQRLGLDLRPPTAAELLEFGLDGRRQLEELGVQLPREADGTLSPRAPGLGSLAAVRRGYEALPGALAGTAPLPRYPKYPWTSFLLYGTQTRGIFSPFTGEPLVSRGLPVAQLPFIAAHELGHQRGYAREEEASFIGLLACRSHPDPAWRYSGALEAFTETCTALAAADRASLAQLVSDLPAGVQADMKAAAAWNRRHSTPVARASAKVYGRYLRAQGQAAGILSYRQVLLLLLGERRRSQGRIAPMESGPPHD